MKKKEQILKAAFQLFSQRGDNFSMSELAERVAIKTPSLYSHFSGKDEIIEIMVKAELERYFSYFKEKTAANADKSAREKISGVLFNTIAYYKQIGRLRFWRNLSFLSDLRLKELFKESMIEKDRFYNQYLKKCFEEGVKNGEIKKSVGDGTIFLFHSMLHGILDGMLLFESSGHDAAKYAKRTWEAFWDGIKTQ